MEEILLVNERDEMLTVSDVAKKLSLKKETIRKYLRKGELKGAKFGTKWRIKEEDLEKFIEDNMNKS